MKVIHFMFRKLLAEANGWAPNWEEYKKWLKNRKVIEAKRLVEANEERERREHNAKVTRQYGLSKPKKETNKPWWEI